MGIWCGVMGEVGCALGCISRGTVTAVHKRAEAGRREGGKRVGAD